MTTSPRFDFWYAVNNTEILVPPRNPLETFGNTLIRYHLLAEPMDSVSTVRHREGRIQAFRPQILTPDTLRGSPLEDGFRSPHAEDFVQWLREHDKDVAILQYGFKIRQETFSETLLHDTLPAVAERIQTDLARSSDPFTALVVGVDEPWEVCLLKLLFDVARRSAPTNARDLRADPDGTRHRIDAAFRAAARDRSQIAPLAHLLQSLGRFAEYEDRFYSIVKSWQT